MESIGDYEIIVSDSSKDRSAEIAEGLGAIVVRHNKQGYGNAFKEGFKKVRGEIVIIGDSDNTYDFSEAIPMLKYIPEFDFVIGRRKYIQKNAMPWLHKYIGNPVLSFMLRILFGGNIQDCHSGFRVIKAEKLKELNLDSTGMEFASEMIIKALQRKYRIKEIPVHYMTRHGESKLNSFQDGWRHVKFMVKHKFGMEF